MLSSYSPHIMEVAYVRCMVVKSEVVIYDGVVGVICFEQVLEGSQSLLGCGFNVVDLDGRKVDGEVCAFSCTEK